MTFALKAFFVALVLSKVQALNIPGAKLVGRIPGVKQMTKLGGNIPVIGRVVFGKQRTRKISKAEVQQAQQMMQAQNNAHQAYAQPFPPQQFPQQFPQQQFMPQPQYPSN